MNTREEWLLSALALVRRHIETTAQVTVPATTRVSCGFPGGRSSAKAIGQCWSVESSADGSVEIFISPTQADPISVLAILVHEAIHAAVGVRHGHKAPFRKAALAAGLEGKMTATVASAGLKTTLQEWTEELGIYPHATLNIANLLGKKQSTRMVKCECNQCGYIARTTGKWIKTVGAPLCPCNSLPMSYDGDSDEEGDNDNE